MKCPPCEYHRATDGADAVEALAAADIDGFVFRIPELGGDGRRALLEVETPFGRPDIGARIEISQRPLSLPPDLLPMVPLPIHARYDVSVEIVETAQERHGLLEVVA